MWLIEQLGQDGRWFIRGSEKFRHNAEYHARRYKAENDAIRIRVGRPLADQVAGEQYVEILAPDF